MSLKQELNEFYHSLSNYDFRLLRTIRDVLIRPAKVTEAPLGKYTSPIRFVLTLFSSIFVGIYLMNPSWVDSYSVIEFWRFPLEVQEFNRKQASISRNYAALMNGTIWIPFYFLALRVLFWRKRSWYFFYKMAMYQTPVIWGLMTVAGFLSLLVENLDQLFLFGLAILFLFQFIVLKLQKWYWSIAKGTLALVVTLWILIYINPIYFSAIQSIVDSHERDYSISTSDSQLEDIVEVKNYIGNPTLNFVMTGPNSGYYLTSWTVGFIENGEVEWWKELDHVYSRLLVTNGKLLMLATNEEDLELSISILNHGEESFETISIPESGKLLNSRIISHSDSTVSVFIRQNEAYVANLSNENERWIVEKDSFSGENKDLFDLIPLSEEYNVASFVKIPHDHVSSMQIGVLSNNFAPLWKETLFEKFSPYNPHNFVQFNVDEKKSELFTHYVLSNDSVMVSYVHSFSLFAGDLNFENTFTIPANAVDLSLRSMDSNYLYLAGEVHKNYSKRFWQPTYHIAVIGMVNKITGDLDGYKFFGPTTWNSHSRVEDLFIHEDTISFFSNDDDGANNLLVDGNSFVFKTFKKSVLIE